MRQSGEHIHFESREKRSKNSHRRFISLIIKWVHREHEASPYFNFAALLSFPLRVFFISILTLQSTKKHPRVRS